MSKRAEFGRFVETTSVKGVGRAYKSPFLVLRAIWALSVCGFLGIATYHTYYLVNDFYENPTITLIKHEYINDFQTPDPFAESPDFTVCNLNPFSSDESLVDIPSIQDYHYRVLQTVYSDHLKSMLLSTEGYYQYIGKENAKTLGHTQSGFIVSCFAEIYDGFTSSWQPCDVTTNFINVSSPSFFNCYSLQVRQHNPAFVAGYSFIFHLDNYNVTWHNYFTSNYQPTNSLGAAIVPHMSLTKAWVQRKAIHVHPGSHADIKLTIQHTTRKEPPLGECRVTMFVPNSTWLYSVKGCISSTLENRIIDVCGCRDASMMNILEDDFPSIPYCLHLHDDVNITLETDECSSKLRLKGYQMADENCPSACQELNYDWSASYALWPVDTLPRIFYDTYIANTSFTWRYQNLYETDKVAYDEAVRQNFASARIYIKDFNILFYQDVVKTTPFALLSSVGAAVNLWAGITVVLVVEVIEVLVRLCLPAQEAQNKDDATAPNDISKDKKCETISDSWTTSL